MAIVQDWRKGELDEWKNQGHGNRAAYASFIREVEKEKGPSGNWAGNKDNDDTRLAIKAAREEMKATGARGDVADYMAKQMENASREASGLKALPDPQASMNRASGAWQAPAQGRPDMGGPDPARLEAFNNKFSRSQPSPGGMQ